MVMPGPVPPAGRASPAATPGAPPATGPGPRPGRRFVRQVFVKLAGTKLLILDDWGITALSAGDCRDVFELVDDRSPGRSTVMASQLPLDTWHAAMADPTLADAILDRLVHGAYKIVLKGESMRKVMRADLSNRPDMT